MLSPRARIVLVEHGKVALIRRVRDGHTYYLFPGGGVEDGETPEEAARREAVEELGVEVELGPLVHQESFGGTIFLYYDAWIVGGELRHGELARPRAADRPRARAKRHPRARLGSARGPAGVGRAAAGARRLAHAVAPATRASLLRSALCTAPLAMTD